MIPPGLEYTPDVFSEDEQQNILRENINKKSWDTTLFRRTQHYNYRYLYKFSKPKPYFVENLATNPWLVDICQRCAPEFRDLNDIQVIINEYKPGQRISAHIDDCIQFSDTIYCLSLGAAATMRFSRNKQTYDISVEPGSVYSFRGEARYKWTHEMLPTLGTRVSVTIRQMKLI